MATAQHESIIDPRAITALRADVDLRRAGVAAAARVHAATPGEASWFGLRTAVLALGASVEQLAQQHAVAANDLRASADQLADVVTVMHAGRRLSPGIEESVAVALEQAGAALDAGLDALPLSPRVGDGYPASAPRRAERRRTATRRR